MNTTTTTAPVLVAPRQSLVQRFGNKISGLFALLAVLTFSAPASASPPPPGLLNGAESSFFSSISGFLTGNLLPLVFVLAAVVIGAGMLFRYGRKAVSS